MNGAFGSRTVLSAVNHRWLAFTFAFALLMSIAACKSAFAEVVASTRHEVTSLRGEAMGYSIAIPPGHEGPFPVLLMPAHPTAEERQFVRVPEVGGPWALLIIDGWNVLYRTNSATAYERLSNTRRVRKKVREAEAAALHDALARYPLDPDRVVCNGSSASGNSCWDLALHWPGVFAGVWPVSAGYHPPADHPCLGNIAGQHFYVLHGTDDPKIPDEWVDSAVAVARSAGATVEDVRISGGGHGAFDPEVWQAGFRWAAAQRRVAPPSPVQCRGR